MMTPPARRIRQQRHALVTFRLGSTLGADSQISESGALTLIYCHLASSHSWNALAYQATLRKAR
jgi:hypothetical protein